MNNIHTNQYAVSPVVGVMLMLVVTIIIAAVVSTFAGGFSKETTKAPQAIIRGTYSISSGMTIEHSGGDPIGTPSIKITVRPAESFGTQTHAVDTINKSTLYDESGTQWVKDNGLVGVKTFKVGDIAYIRPPYHEASWLQPTSSYSSYFNSTANVGKTFWVEIVDPRGQMIAKTEVMISP